MTRDDLLNSVESNASDALVDEARSAGQAYLDSMNGDWRAIIEDLRRRSAQPGRSVVSLSPKPLKSESAPTKKAG